MQKPDFKKFRIGRVTLGPSRPLITGIVNVTPDSFSDGGIAFKKADAVRRALQMEEEGADIIDIGGQSSRPASTPVSLKEELKRVIPVIEAVRKKSNVAISIDTVKPEVARRAVEAGADAINDIGGFTDPGMVEVAALCQKPVVVMHMKGTPQTMQKNPRYKNVLGVVGEVAGFLKKRCGVLKKSGVKKIIVDPGIGFGKTLRHNLELLKNLDRLCALGFPVMVGASRKSMIGEITGTPVTDRLGGSIAVHLWALANGAAIIRVHDVAPHRHALDIFTRLR
ncbi:MAG: dihydropteroate synthase [Nitrospinota bacterium]